MNTFFVKSKNKKVFLQVQIFLTSVCVQVVEDKMSGKVHNYKENEKMRNKTVIVVLSMVMIFVLAACGKTNEWVGTYGGTSTSWT